MYFIQFFFQNEHHRYRYETLQELLELFSGTIQFSNLFFAVRIFQDSFLYTILYYKQIP